MCVGINLLHQHTSLARIIRSPARCVCTHLIVAPARSSGAHLLSCQRSHAGAVRRHASFASLVLGAQRHGASFIALVLPLRRCAPARFPMQTPRRWCSVHSRGAHCRTDANALVLAAQRRRAFSRRRRRISAQHTAPARILAPTPMRQCSGRSSDVHSRDCVGAWRTGLAHILPSASVCAMCCTSNCVHSCVRVGARHMLRRCWARRRPLLVA